jgi:hypothetical protein
MYSIKTERRQKRIMGMSDELVVTFSSRIIVVKQFHVPLYFRCGRLICLEWRLLLLLFDEEEEDEAEGKTGEEDS